MLGCVPNLLGDMLNLSEPEFSHLQNGGSVSYCKGRSDFTSDIADVISQRLVYEMQSVHIFFFLLLSQLNSEFCFTPTLWGLPLDQVLSYEEDVVQTTIPVISYVICDLCSPSWHIHEAKAFIPSNPETSRAKLWQKRKKKKNNN